MKERKKLHRLLSIVLCFMLVAGMMPAMSQAAFATNTITTVEASGIKAPVAGESPTDSSYKTVTLPSGQGYKLLDVVWYSDYENSIEASDFEAGKKYYAEVWVDAETGYQFANTSDINVSYEGEPPYPDSVEVRPGNARMFFAVEFLCLKNRVTDKESLIYAFNETDYSTIILDDDIMLDSAAAIKWINRDITLDLNGHVITAKADGVQYRSVFSIESGGKLTIKDSGNGGGIIFDLEKMPNTYINYLIDVCGGSLLIEGGTFSLTASTQKNGVLIYCEGSSTDVNITGGTFDTTDINAKEATYCIYVTTSYSKKDTINISNAEFNTNDKAILLSSNFAPEIRNLTIDNCTFNHKDTAIYIGCGTTKISNTTFYSKDSCYAISTKDDAKSPTIADCFAAGQYAYVNGNAYQYGYVNGVPDSITARNLGKKATGTKVEIKSGIPAASVTSVKVDSESEVVARGDTLQCSATVSGVGDFNRDVTWEVNGGASGTTIDEDGLLTVASNESASGTENGIPAGQIKVKATAAGDATKSGEVIVRLYYDINAIDCDVSLASGITAERATAGAQIVVSAKDIAGKQFVKWEVVSGDISLDDSRTTQMVVMPAGDIELKAIYKNIYTISFDPNGGSGTMDNIVTDETQYKLPECTFIPPEGKVFKIWSKSTSISGYISNGILNLTGDITVYPIWGNPRLDVTDGTAKDGAGNDVSTSDSNRSVAAGTEITITANAAPEDYAFDKWEVVSGNVTFADANSQVTSFIMPGENVEVKATYKHVNHTYGGWESDGINHWKECTCGYKSDVEAHSYNSVVTAKATTSKNGTVEKECLTCGDKITETIYYPETIKLSYTSATYNGKEKSPTVSVKDAAGNTLAEGTDYDVTVPTGRVNAGTYTYKVVFKGNYTGSKSLTLTINKASFTPTVKGYSGTYNGSKHTITLSGVKSGSTVKYRTSPTGSWTTTKPTRTSVGKTTVYYQITNKNYKTVTGSKTIVINPVKTYITSLSKGTKSFTVKWAKKTTQTTGYQIQYSTSSTFASGNKTVTVTSNKTTSKTIKSLKANKKYYVRVRTYKTVNGYKYVSGWSAKKYVTTKA